MEEVEYYFHGAEDDAIGAHEFVWPQSSIVDVDAVVQDAYMRVDNIHNDMQQAVGNEEEVEDEEQFLMQGPNFEELVRELQETIYEGCQVNCLQVCIVLITMCNLFSIPNTFLDELLKFLLQDLLSKLNSLPRTSYEARQMVRKLGLQHEAIHCCPDGHDCLISRS